MAIIGFIGTGNMGGALALAAGRNTEGDRILLYDKDKQTALRISHGIPRSRVTERDELVDSYLGHRDPYGRRMQKMLEDWVNAVKDDYGFIRKC